MDAQECCKCQRHEYKAGPKESEAYTCSLSTGKQRLTQDAGVLRSNQWDITVPF